MRIKPMNASLAVAVCNNSVSATSFYMYSEEMTLLYAALKYVFY